jgi:hypothetical protein
MASRALALHQALRNVSGEADTLALLGRLHQASGQLSAAIEYNERDVNLYRALRDRSREDAALTALSGLYEVKQKAKESEQETAPQ